MNCSVVADNYPPCILHNTEQELSLLEGVGTRGSRESVRAFLMNLTNPGGVLASVEPRIIHELCDYYDHARYHPMQFTQAQFTPYHSLLLKILHWYVFIMYCIIDLFLPPVPCCT